jgi:PAS domain S-box-containing protein
MEDALARGAGGSGQPWDLVISDYYVPSFGALGALEVVRQRGLDLPFVVVSGLVGEETAVEAMRMGAHDFVGKGNLARLNAVVARELREVRSRWEAREAEAALREEEKRFEALVRNSSDLVVLVDAGGTILYESPAVERILGYKPEERVGGDALGYLHPEDRERIGAAISRMVDSPGGVSPPVEYRVRDRWGRWRHFEAVGTNLLHEPGVEALVVNARDVTERREAEEARRLGEARFRALSEATEEGVAFHHAGRILDSNATFARMFGYAGPEEVIGLPVGGFVAPNSDGSGPRDLRVLEREDEGGSYELVGVRKDGTTFPVGSVDKAGSYMGRPARVSLIRDLTERKRAEEALRESEQRFRATFEQAAVGVSLVAPDGRVLRVNEKLCEILGYAQEEVLGHNVRRVSFPEDLEEDQRRLARVLAGETGIYPVEKRYVRKDGSAVWVNLSSSVVRDADGEPVYLVGVTEDITERKLAEEALAQSEERYRTVVEQAADCIFLVDAHSGAILETNAAFERLLGYGEEEALDLTVYDLAAHDRESEERNVRRALREGSLSVGERSYRRKDGSLLDVEVGISAMRQAGLEVLCVVAHDITERKETENSLRRTLSVLLALREAGQLLSSTLQSEEIVERLLNVMRGVSELSAAVISVPDGESGELRVWRSSGLESLWEKARYAPEAEEARRSVLLSGRRCFFRLHSQDGDGELPALYLPLKSRERTVGVLEAYGTAYLEGEDAAGLLESLANGAASALENARLYGELAERERRLQELVGKILVAQEEERRRVAYEVHDGLAQAAAAAHQRLQSFAYRHPPATEVGERDLRRALGLVQRTVRDARKVIANLRPTVLDDFGLAAAVRHEVDELREEGWQIDYEEGLGEERLPTVLETSLFRVAQEALTNARKHSGTSRARLELERVGETVRLQVRDYGEGFEPGAVTAAENGPGERVGLSGMRERVHMLGGELELRSRPGESTTVEATIPIPKDAETWGPGLPMPGGGG